MPNVFEEAFSTVDGVNQIVVSRINDATETAGALQLTALDTIEALSNVNLAINGGAPPAIPIIDPTIDVTLELPEITPVSFGTITSNLPDDPDLDNVPDIAPLVIPVFAPSVTGFNLPEPPQFTAPIEPPDRPDIGEVVIPVIPTLVMPLLPALDDIEVPEFAGITLPVFSATAPEFAATALPGILQWTEPTYEPEILDEVMDKIRTLWSGGSGIPPAVEQAMVERAMSREDMIANREIDAITEEFSLRGFTMPTGMQAARVDRLRQDLAVKKLGLNRELTIKFAETQIENIRFGVQQAIAGENVYVNLFTNMAQRTFEAAKFQIESQLNIYNAQVALYNAQMNGYQIEAQVFNIRVQAELAKIEIFKAEIEAELARGQVNEQKVRIYAAQIQALQTEVEIHKARMQGAEIESAVIRNQIDAYRVDVEAYGARIAADKTRFEIYEVQVKGEAAKGGILDAEARAYASLVQGKASAADIDVKRAEVTIQKNRALIEGFVALLDLEKSRVQSQLAVVQSGAQAYIANTQRFAAQATAETAKAQTIVSAKEAEQRTNVAFYQAQVQAWIGNMEQLIRRASISVDALKAAGQISSTLAAGAMAGVHVGANLSGGGSVAASGAYGESTSTSSSTSVQTSTNTNYNYEGT